MTVPAAVLDCICTGDSIECKHIVHVRNTQYIKETITKTTMTVRGSIKASYDHHRKAKKKDMFCRRAAADMKPGEDSSLLPYGSGNKTMAIMRWAS